MAVEAVPAAQDEILDKHSGLDDAVLRDADQRVIFDLEMRSKRMVRMKSEEGGGRGFIDV